MSDGEEQSKRQRQKDRRAAKRAEQQRALAAAKRRRMLATVGVVVLALVGIGALLSGQIRGFFERREVVAEAEERREELGCTEIEEMEDLGAGHFPQDASADDLAEVPPDAIYDHRPTTSGPHFGQVLVTGAYDDYVDERLTTHNMEHGYVIAWWDPELPEPEAEAIRSWAAERIDDGREHMIAAPYNEPLPDGASVAFTAWGYRQVCEGFDETIGDAFLAERHNAPDVPEAGAGPHLGGAAGEVDPATDAVVFSPFTDAVPGAAAMEDDGSAPEDE